ncbi:Fc.00g001990.m01.CDS01 [Cosmosporella sp. VM-42]
MSGSGGFQTAVEHIDAVDAFARNLYLRAKQSGPPFDGISGTIRNLHLALRHLRVEAADPDSLLNRTDVSVYARQLKPMVEDCDFALKQLVTVLDKYGDGKPADDERVRAERVAAIRSKLVNEKTNVDLFLDTVQLHNPANKPDRVVDGSQGSLEGIKDKVDVIASRLFQRRDGSGFAEDEDGLWQEFKAELEKEGFAPQVLKKHKDVLRAYIRELESMSTQNGGTCPTVRGLLEHEAKSRPTSPKEIAPSGGNEKFPTGMKIQSRRPEHAPEKADIYSDEEDTASDTSESLALISTRDLMAMDSLNAGMAGMHLQPTSQQYTLSRSAPTQRYLPSNAAGILSGPEDPIISTSPTAMAASPRFVPPIPPYAPEAPPPYGASPQPARLAPDRYGNQIPAEAQWTKIKRTLVSPEVLERAGVRYEARPEYVAILGHLSREEIAEYARQSAAARARRNSYPPRKFDRWDRRRSRSDSRSTEEDDESDLFDESDSTDVDDDKTSEKGTKRYLHVVDPPEKKTSPSSTVQPKPILKNKNENRVRFDPQPHEVETKSPRSLKDDRDHTRRRERPPPAGFRRPHRDNSRRYSDSVPNDRHRSDRYNGSGGEYFHDSRSSGRRHHRERRGSRRDDRQRDERQRDERQGKKKAWGETLGAVGIGGAAATLLSVLAEAASVV